MDYTLDVIISKQDLDFLNIPEIKVEWCGEVFSQDPKRYMFRGAVLLYENTNFTYYHKFVDDYFDGENYLALVLELRCLKELEHEVNHLRSEKMIIEFSDFLNEIYKAEEPFCILLGIDDELLNKKILINDVNEARDLLFRCLDWKFPQSLLIVKSHKVSSKY